MPLNLDIHSAVQTAFLMTLVGILLSVWIGVRTIRAGQRLPFFRKRRDRMVRGWRMVFSGVILAILALFLNRFAEPVIYKVYPPSPTVTNTPTITPTPTMTTTPTVTLTPTITPTTSITPTPFVPPTLAAGFASQVTPSPDSVFSPLIFSQRLTESKLPDEPGTEFKNPVGHLYASFSYDRMLDGSQWTALWYRGSELVFFETKPWDGGTGGYGYTDWNPAAAEWLAGEYDVYIFNGLEYKTTGHFTVTGDPVGVPAAQTPKTTLSATRSPTPRLTPTNTRTPRPSSTPAPSRTPTVTRTRPPTSTMRPSLTPRPTDTHWPTATELPTERP